MIDFPHLSSLVRKNDAKIVMLVVDGLGSIPHPVHGRSELEAARIPNLDNLARRSAAGSIQMLLPGVTVGSGPGHLALFGYDPLKYQLGRGALEAMGAGLELAPGDIAARGNFATVDADGVIVDRRAGRLDSAVAAGLIEKLSTIKLDGVETTPRLVDGYRFVLRLRGAGLDPGVSDTDPQQTGVPLPEPVAGSKQAAKAAKLAAAFAKEARAALNGSGPANAVMLRGWSGPPALPSFCDNYGLRAAAIASLPMYRGVGQLVGMDVLPTGETLASELDTLQQHWADYDFFYLHYKDADVAGESLGFAAKKQALENLDVALPRLLALKPDVLIVTGDHSTPSFIESHSWHPVPLLVNSKWSEGDGVHRFNEREVRAGSLGTMDAKHVMLLALAHAGRLLRFGA
ncbi:MAG: 2,3-bisphosphoglycerate-independent phosphoglycerate mutase [Dehalococcoidia bacterium]